MRKLFSLILLIIFSTSAFAADFCCLVDDMKHEIHHDSHEVKNVAKGSCHGEDHGDEEGSEDDAKENHHCSTACCSTCMPVLSSSFNQASKKLKSISVNFHYLEKNIKTFHQKLLRPPTA